MRLGDNGKFYALMKKFNLEKENYKDDTKQNNYRPAGNKFNASANNRNNNQSNSSAKPTAPYNFVSLNDKVVQPPLAEYTNGCKDLKQAYKDFMAQGEKYSGYFDVELKNVTPLYIAGANGAFNDGKNYCIPGSSLRGCLKNIFKIITCGSMRVGTNPDVTDKILYFRTFASAFKPLRVLYSDRMTKIITNNKGQKVNASVAQPGFLVRMDKKYYVCPANLQRQRGSGVDGKIVWENDCAEIYTGKIDGKKHFYRINAPHWNERYTITDDLLNSYRDDKNRKGMSLLDNNDYSKRGTDNLAILKGAEKYDYVIPCFYVADNGVVEHFGAGPYYRIPYRTSIGSHIPQNLKDDSVDFTDAVFGSKEAWGSRVFFEDLYLNDNEKGTILPEAYMKPLMTPNSTSFQNYLEPDVNGNAQHWDIENAKLRGYKMYWHKQPQWQEDPAKSNDKFNKKIAPLKPGQHFYGRIRFENLDKTELGALAKLFELGAEQNCCYKLGMGKPFGLGSVELKAKLYLKNADYYISLFGNEGFEGYAETDMQHFIANFDTYMNDNLGSSVKLYNERINELKIIMSMANINKQGWNNKTAYMGLAGSAKKLVNNRITLPSIEEVIKG